MAKREVRVLLRGGLGNQLFQYATGRSLAHRLDAPLCLDLSWFDDVLLQKSSSVTPRKYALAPFGLDARLLRTRFPATLASAAPGVAKLYGKLERRWRRPPRLDEVSFRFDSRIEIADAPVELVGYWQSQRYFLSVADQIRREIGIPGIMSERSKRFLALCSEGSAICVHLRRGDYVSNAAAASHHGTCSLDYYQRAVGAIQDGLTDPWCLVFSDEPDWVREKVRLPLKMIVVDANGPEDAHQDLWLMAACQHFVIANSSLSWWGAWLGRHPGKRVIAPQQWFSDPSMDTSDLIPDTWCRI